MNSVVKNPTKVYVGSIPRDVPEDEIEDMFRNCGKVVAFEYKGEFAFVEFTDSAGAEDAIRYVFYLKLIISFFFFFFFFSSWFCILAATDQK